MKILHISHRWAYKYYNHITHKGAMFTKMWQSLITERKYQNIIYGLQGCPIEPTLTESNKTYDNEE